MKIKQNRFSAGSLFIIILIFFNSNSALPQIKQSNCLWEIQTEFNTVYLLGSIHFLRESSYPLNRVIESSFSGLDRLVLEMNLDSASTPKAKQYIFSRGMLENHKTLKDVLSDTTYQIADLKLKNMGMNMLQLQSFKPWFVTLSLMALKLQSLGYNPEFGIDRYFFQKAKKHNMEIIGLETIEDQIGLFDKMSLDDQGDLILQTINELDVFDKEIDTLVYSWSIGDVSFVEEILLKSFIEFPNIYQKFIFGRNLKWIPVIESCILSDQKTMIIVGAGHLVGKDGIIQMLRQKGYEPSQM